MAYRVNQRSPAIRVADLPSLHAHTAAILEQLGAVPLAVGGVEDHIHLLFKLLPTQSLAEIARKVKAKSSFFLRRSNPYSRGKGGTAHSRVGESGVEKVISYIKRQREHHHTNP